MSFPYLLLTSNTFGGREVLHKDRFEVETLHPEGLCLGRRPSVVNHVHGTRCAVQRRVITAASSWPAIGLFVRVHSFRCICLAAFAVVRKPP